MRMRTYTTLLLAWTLLAMGAALVTRAARAPAGPSLWRRATLQSGAAPCRSLAEGPTAAPPPSAAGARQLRAALPPPPQLVCADASDGAPHGDLAAGEEATPLLLRSPEWSSADAETALAPLRRCVAPQGGPFVSPSALPTMSAALRLTLGVPLALNCSDAAALAGIPGVGRSAARSVVAHRAAHGPILSARELRAVPRVGPTTARRLLAGTTGPVPCTPATRDAWHPPEARATPSGVQRAWVVEVVRFLPQGIISRCWGWLARLRRPLFFVDWFKATFISATGIDMGEAALPLAAYGSLEDLFVRTLRPGLRPIEGDVQTLVSPVDARVGAWGTVEEGLLFQIKGRPYTLAQLFDDAEKARQFEGGAYLTLYLSPRDYHRIHAPAAGHVVAARLVPGRLMPVFEESLQRCEALFARNERIITYLRAIDAGDMAVVAVGATLVGHMRVAYDDTLRGNAAGNRARTVRYDKPAWLEKGGELGAFELGSTVVLVFQKGKIALDPLPWGAFVRMGQRIGRAQGEARSRDQGGGPQLVRRLDDDDDPVQR